MKVLLVEDEAELRRSIRTYLQEAEFMVDSARDLPAALDKTASYTYDAVLVDITLPHGSGLDLVRTLQKRNPDTGVIIISARDSLEDKVLGLQLGADDYLPKPFHLPELVARLRALMRRRNFHGQRTLEFDELRIIPEETLVEVNGERIDLTAIQFRILLFLATNKDRVISRSALVEHVWGEAAERIDHDDFLYTHMKNLRRKLEEKGCEDRIRTVYGLGYRFHSRR